MESGFSALAVDIGSSSVKAGLISVAGDVIAAARARLDRSLPFPQMWLAAIRNALASALSAAGPSFSFGGLGSVVVSGAGPTLVAVDGRGEAIACLMWNDSAPQADAPLPKGAERSIFFPRIAALPKAFPGIEKRAHRVFSGPEFAVFCLCGGECSVLPEARYAPAYWTGFLVEAAGFGREAFPPFCEPGFVAGAYREDASPYSRAFSGILPEGIPVRAGLPDFAAALLGTGTIQPGKACDRAGTSEGLNVCTASPVHAEGLRTLPSPVAGLWNISCLFGETGKELARLRASLPQSPSISCEGAFGKALESPADGPAGMGECRARACAEEICLKLKGGIERLKAATGFCPEFALSGGQAKSRAWNQMKADITGSVFLLAQTESAELLGDAITAFCASGEYSSYAEACAAMIRITERFEPRVGRAATRETGSLWA